jgi:hypothetical protein
MRFDFISLLKKIRRGDEKEEKINLMALFSILVWDDDDDGLEQCDC